MFQCIVVRGACNPKFFFVLRQSVVLFMSSSLFLNCWFLTGPTASGKTSVATPLAHQINAEIVSLDSMAVYRGMDIGTAKPTEQDRQRVPHHLVDVMDPNQEFSIAEYLAAAESTVAEVHSRGKAVVFVGGTPLYLKALLRGMSAGPAPDWEFRQQVKQELERHGQVDLHKRLEQIDPLSASKIHPNDTKRMIRALEVHKLTGQPISHQQVEFEDGHQAEDCRVFVLEWPKHVLHQRIDERVQNFFERGIVEEVQQLLEKFGPLSRTAIQAVGYREVVEYLEGLRDLEQTIELVKIRTHRFAKHQVTWFRSLSECRTHALDGPMNPTRVAEEIVQLGEAS